jgi:hypothetical protein
MPDYINPTTGFFSGLAGGIEEFRREQETQARDREDRTRKETLGVLTGLLDKATPETAPILLRQIGDVMKFKGKERGIWDQLTGSGLDNTTTGLQGKLNNVLAMVQPAGTRPRTVADAPPAIRLRDPFAESIEKIQAQYDLRREADINKLTQQQALLGERERGLEEQRQKNRLELDEQRAYNKAYGDVYKEAALMPGGPSNRANLAAAVDKVASLNSLNRDKLKAQIGLYEAKTDESKATADSLRSSGIPGAKPLQAMQFGEQQKQRLDSIFKDYNSANAKADSLRQQIKSIEDGLVAFGKSKKDQMNYDPNTMSFTRGGKPVGMMATVLMNEGLQKGMQALPALRRELSEAEGQARGLSGQLKTAPNFFKEENGRMTAVPDTAVGTMRNVTGGEVVDATDRKRQAAQSVFDTAVGGTITITDAQPHKPGEQLTMPNGSTWVYVKPAAGGKGMDKRWTIRRVQ